MYKTIKYSDQQLAKTLYNRALLFISIILFIPPLMLKIHFIKTGVQDAMSYFRWYLLIVDCCCWFVFTIFV
ncbi:DNA segregation ATPase FtsK/SpoIIIE [Weissella oryzae SG25]|uniref:DNA segregation ATPase FtsK/SpoIIIE n=1 Tax=Weissella oryzae (strain DSM 25784 / JCM 18191 / LMG 30913 / SG25) TaxID=1329250 RepID=A0A069D0F8_WEIOS|nr:DNA segregation ATPase FtsK/SpoIIIE [Weissella oryzae SG25]